MWLFHTATLNDLSPSCVRYRLLQYCQNPHVEQTALEGLNLEEIRSVARTADRERIKPLPPFDSWFEVDVFLMIASRGYRVIPQFEVADYRIDLVVEGMQGRLAVECDGDVWHGADHYAYDMARQRMLERCELTFWRVRGSTFYRDPAAAMEGLWSILDRHGIYPIARQGTLHTAHPGDTSSREPIRQEEVPGHEPGSDGAQEADSVQTTGAAPTPTMDDVLPP
jgi:very-short-patch-repair endonuclease